MDRVDWHIAKLGVGDRHDIYKTRDFFWVRSNMTSDLFPHAFQRPLCPQERFTLRGSALEIIITWRCITPCLVCLGATRRWVIMYRFRPLSRYSCGLDGRRSVPSGKKRFFCAPQRQQRPWDSPTPVSNGYRGLFPRRKSGRGLKLTTHLHLVPKSILVELLWNFHTLHHRGVVLN
jgi:hypothetical protein